MLREEVGMLPKHQRDGVPEETDSLNLGLNNVIPPDLNLLRNRCYDLSRWRCNKTIQIN